MANLRDNPADFEGAIQAAAGQRGLDPTYIEKDYWVTQVLRVLQRTYPPGFMFKGGTSLSKGYRLIERFSEDIDILVVPTAGQSTRERERHLEEMTTTVSADLGIAWRPQRPPSRGRLASRGDFLDYPVRIQPAVQVQPRGGIGIGHGSVLLEAGYGEGHEPCEVVEVGSILGDVLGIGDEYEDLAGFKLRALEPRRTLIEKLFALHDVATRWEGTPAPAARRFGRHYYDVFRVLEDPATLRKLENRPQFDEIVSQVERISASQFGGTSPRPAEGFSVSPAFQPSGELREWLEAEYRDALELIPAGANQPAFAQVLRRVRERSSLL